MNWKLRAAIVGCLNFRWRGWDWGIILDPIEEDGWVFGIGLAFGGCTDGLVLGLGPALLVIGRTE